jgi:uncharacterized repeat protein (TIGR02543 family)
MNACVHKAGNQTRHLARAFSVAIIIALVFAGALAASFNSNNPKNFSISAATIPMEILPDTVLSGTTILRETTGYGAVQLSGGYIYKFEAKGQTGGTGGPSVWAPYGVAAVFSQGSAGYVGEYAIGYLDLRDASSQNILWFANNYSGEGWPSAYNPQVGSIGVTFIYNDVPFVTGPGGTGGFAAGFHVGSTLAGDELLVAKGGRGGTGGIAILSGGAGGSGGGYTSNRTSLLTPALSGVSQHAKGIYSADEGLNEAFGDAGVKITRYEVVAVPFSITYHYDGGAPADGVTMPMTYSIDNEQPNVALPQSIIKTGYTFGGWYTNEQFTGSAVTYFPIIDMINKTFYAKWNLVVHSIVYNLGVGESHVGIPPTSYSIESENTITLGTAYKTGYTFDGWYDNPSRTGDIIVSFPKTDACYKEFYAKFIPNVLTIVFDANGGTGTAEDETGYYGGQVIIPSKDVFTAPSLYRFICWTVYANGVFKTTLVPQMDPEALPLTIAALDLTADLANGNATVTFQATYALMTSYIIYYFFDGGEPTDTMTTEYYPSDSGSFNIPPAVKEGYTFKGWYDNAGFAGNPVSFYTIPALTEDKRDVSFWAKWQINTFTATFVSGGGSAVANQTIDWNETILKPSSDPTRDGHTFDGWWADGDFETEFDFNVLVTRDYEIYAKWVINTHTVTFETGAAGIVIDPLVVDWGTVISAPDPSPEFIGYTFGGWYLDNGFETVYNFATPITANFTLYAKWTILTFAVAFETNGGSAVQAQNVDWMGTITIPTDPTRAGHTFDGWWTSDDFEIEFNFSSPVTETQTAYAKWIIHIHTVTFLTGEEGASVEPQTVNWGTTITEPDVPEVTGITFGGWYLDDGFEMLYNFATPVTGDFTLFAKWITPPPPPPPVTHWWDGAVGFYKKYGSVQNIAIVGGSVLALIILIIFLRGVPKRRMKYLKSELEKRIKQSTKDFAVATQLVSDFKFNREDTALQQKTMDAIRTVKHEMSQATEALKKYKDYKKKHCKSKRGEKPEPDPVIPSNAPQNP